MSTGVRCWAGLLTWIGLVSLTGQANAQPKPADEPPLLFRREYLPKSLLARQKDKLIPVPRKDFDQWLEATRARAAGTLPQAWIESIEVRAVLQGNLLIGQARLEVRRRQSAQASSEATLLSLTGLKLPIMQPKWEEKKEAATVGMTPEGALVALVDHSDTLTFDWQLSGRRDPFGAELFDLSVAESPRRNLFISLPAGSRLEASAGLVERKPLPDALPDTWKVSLGGARETRLRCVPDGDTAPGPLVLVREENHCTVTQGELETQCQLRLDVYREPVTRMEVELIGEWSPTMVRQGDTQVPFEVSTDGRTAVLQFEPPLTGVNRRLTFAGRAAVEDRQRVVVPRVRIKDAAWLDGAFSVDAGKVLLRGWELEGIDCAAGEQMPGITRRWTLRSDRALAAFVVDRLPGSLRAETGSTVRLDVEGATASVVADFTAESGEAFELAGEIAPGWVVDSLETVPPQSLDDWEVVADDSRQHLRVGLRRSVSSAQAVRVTIEAHRPAPTPGENLGSDQLRPVRWQMESKGYLALGIDPLWQIGFRGAEQAPRVDPGLLTDAQSERLAIAEDVLLFADDDAFDSARLELAAESPQFTADWQLRIGCDGNRFKQQAELRIEPTATPVERVHVLVRPAAGKAVQWQLSGEESSAMEARLVRVSDDPAGEDEWELTLVRARRNPFTVLANLEAETAGRYTTRFFRCVEASAQPARVVLAREPHSLPTVEQASGLSRLWTDGADSSALAQWSFDPAQSPVLTVRLGTPQELRQLLLVEQAVLETRLTRQHFLHTVDYTVLNQQAQAFIVHLPSGSEIDQVLVDNRRIDPRLSSDAGQLSIALPSKATPLDVQIAFRTLRASGGATTRVDAAWPEASLPAATRSWRIVFPDNYREFTWSSPAAWTWSGLWQRMQAPLPGFEPPQVAAGAGAPLACRQLEFHSATGLPDHLHLIDGNVLRGLSWLLMAGCWAIVVRLPLRRQQTAWLIGAIGFSALCLPASIDPLGRMMLLGCAAGLITRQMHRTPAHVPATPMSPLVAPAATALLLAVLMCAASATGVIAQERKPADMIHRVLFPVDEAGKPVDDYIYVSEPFYKELYRRAHQPAARGPVAILVSAEYRARPRSDALSWDTLDAALTIESLHPGPVQIPWPREGFILPAERVRLDGRPAPIAWNEEGKSFTISIESAGRHTLQFVAQPTKRDAAQCTLALPPAATARLLLDTLDDAAQVQAWPGPLAVASTGEDGVQTFELGQRRDVTLISRPIDAAAVEVEAEQLLWANLWRGGGVVEGRWRFRAGSGTLPETVVDVGPDLELLSAGALTPASVRWESAEGQSEEASSRMIWTPRTPTDELVVEAVFLWRGGGAERILPTIEPSDATVTRRWLATDLRGSTELALVKTAEKVDVAEFAALWNAEDWPLTAQSLAQPGPVSLSEAHHESGLTYAATTNCEITSKVTRFEFRGEVKTLDRPLSLIRLSVPTGATIVSADVGIAGQFRAAPWLPLAGDHIGLLPTEPLRAGNLLVIRAELPGGDGEQVFTPPAIVGGQVTSHAVNVNRRSDVQATVTDHPGFRLAELPRESSSVIPVARFELDDVTRDVCQLRWTLEPNQPRTVAILVTTLRPEGQQWIVRLDAFLAVRDGVADAFHLESSGGWSSPRLVAGDASLQTKDLPGGVRQMIFKPREASANRYHFACEGTVPAQRVQTPLFRLLGAENVQQYVRLPRGENLTWTTSGIQEADLPAAATAPLGDELTVYRAAVSQFHAELLSTQPVTSTPRAAWGSVRVSARANRAFVATCDFAVAPSGANSLDVTLPPDSLLVQASVEGEAVVARLKGQRRIEIPLRSSVLPQQVRVVYSGEQMPAELESLAPHFDAQPDEPLRLVSNGDASPPPPLHEIVPLLTAALHELPQPDAELVVWSRAWLARLKAAQAAAGDETTEEEQQEANKLIGRLESIAQNVMTEIEPASATPVLPAREPPPPVAAPQSPAGPWWIAMLAWLGIVAGGHRVSLSTRLQELACRWPSAAAALIALGVAVLVSPWIGGALLAVAAGSSLAWPWQKRP